MPRASGWTRQNVGGVDIGDEEYSKRVDDRIAEYSRQFETDSLTFLDVRMLRNLAEIETTVDIINQATKNPARFTPAELKSVTDSKAKLLSELRAQAAALGMDRKSRIVESESELETYLPKLHREAKEFLYKHAMIILCPHCLAEPARVEIRQGTLFVAPTLIYHFAYESPTWKFESDCPRCHKHFEINSTNYTDFLYSKIDPYQNEDTEDTTVEEMPVTALDETPTEIAPNED